ncbi:molybdopterin-dependent oxidoreductase [Streptomyces sp. NPDC017958]|uniref:molybdopterin-dependent oxidoreductase n=1 Tax=Streptomyces sp. NPDC017958 TaxID=3365021 RepID=UPI0037B04276
MRTSAAISRCIWSVVAVGYCVSTPSAGRSPLPAPIITVRSLPVRCGAVSGVVRIPLSTVLDLARPRPSARHVWFQGASTGSYAGEDGLAYLKDLPLQQAHDEVVLAQTVNGEPLLASHGFPLRAVAPRMFGTNPAKWLTRIHLADTRRTPPSEDAPSPVREVARGVVRPDVDIRPAATLVAAPLPPAGGT